MKKFNIIQALFLLRVRSTLQSCDWICVQLDCDSLPQHQVIKKSFPPYNTQGAALIVLFTEAGVSFSSAVSTRQYMAFQTVPQMKACAGGRHPCDLLISDHFAGISVALLRPSLRHLNSWFIVGSVGVLFDSRPTGRWDCTGRLPWI